ncbi:beta-ketoacyl-[acyl-carrier-protein] synthase family protein [Orbus mooreae]|uniref:beta-ketoacyl-[acyl-carrier-protein] synthase family protein n=1 Tax=Orbus mooreae TaxID=3074107 RepID=UPI00370DC905
MVYIAALGAVNSLGSNIANMRQSLAQNYNAPHHLTKKKGWILNDESSWFGEADYPLSVIPDALQQFASRNNQLLYNAYLQIKIEIEQIIAEYGQQRVAVIMGTSTSGIHEGDLAVKHYLQTQTLPKHYTYNQQELGDPSCFLATLLGLQGPAYTISTACTSSARAIISGKRLIDAGIVDAAIVGGADSLSRMPINGFYALDSISKMPCMPFSQDRNGINIGEASALFLLTKKESSDIAVLGTGESSDAHHISAPHPDGTGAEKAMRMALHNASLNASDIGYINLHGTATELNDLAESKAVYRLFQHTNTPCSSTKHLTGHTLGTAAATELALSYLLIEQKMKLPQQDFSISPFDSKLDKISIITHDMVLEKPLIMSNSFAFGGNNTSLIIGKK